MDMNYIKMVAEKHAIMTSGGTGKIVSRNVGKGMRNIKLPNAEKYAGLMKNNMIH